MNSHVKYKVINLAFSSLELFQKADNIRIVLLIIKKEL